MGAPTPIQECQLTPISEALNLLVGFSSGEVIMEGEELKHIPSISESLDSIWVTLRGKILMAVPIGLKWPKWHKKNLVQVSLNNWQFRNL